MKVVFRADASSSIGAGHVMRCLTLAGALRKRRAECSFVCCEHSGHLLDLIRNERYATYGLPVAPVDAPADDWRFDAARTRSVVTALKPDWLVVDQYQLGDEWESEMRAASLSIMAIDDIGRAHRCEVLLDQNLTNPAHARYESAAANGTRLLLGPGFALVRPEFAALRPAALARRNGTVSAVIVSMGGSDPEDETSKALDGLAMSRMKNAKVDVVIGSGNANRKSVEASCLRLPNATLHVQTTRMAGLMVAADIALTAGGSTTWERCCLGLPALVSVLSDDQVLIADAVASAGGQIVLGRSGTLTPRQYAAVLDGLTPSQLRHMSVAAAGICDGLGAERVANQVH